MGDSSATNESVTNEGSFSEERIEHTDGDATAVLAEGSSKLQETPISQLSKRSFAIKGLRHPGWRKSDELFELFTTSESFDIEFEPSRSGGQKRGRASLIFSNVEAALHAYKLANSIRIYGKPLEIEASLDFYPMDSNSRFLPPEDELKKRTLFVLHLPPDSDKDFLDNIFEIGDVEACELIPMPNANKQQAKVTFLSSETAQAASDEAEGCVIDGVKTFFWNEYDAFMLNESKAQILQRKDETETTEENEHHPLENGKLEDSGDKENQEQTTSEKIEATEENIIASIHQLIHAKRINFSDWNAAEDIYQELDEVSSLYGGLPDSLLKPCLLKVLEQYLSGESGWMRQHLEFLIKLWKKEVVSSILFERPTRVQLKSRQLSPSHEATKKRKRPPGKDLKQRLGVGMFLQQARTLMTDEGEVDIEEDEVGNITIGGEALTFDSWAKFNKTDIVTPIVQPQTTTTTTIMSKEEWEKRRYEKRMAAKARRKARKAEKLAMMKGEEEETKAEPKVLEEGEVDSGEEQKVKTKRLKASTSSSSSSSSESDDDVEGQGSRHRRRERRKKERMGTIKTASVRLPGVLQSLYDRRIELLSLLSIEHRNAFANVLNVVMSSEKVMTTSQREMMLSKMKMMFPGN